jgi:uroporphyrin-III C-methyltransferase/precorrin-2 dehydrogenase/sirohydrochlorin ferrochelatase
MADAALVSLVGAGPGDPELITLKGARRLQHADLVLYDALVARELLELAPRAQKCFVGKRAGQKSLKQTTIEQLMINGARRGQRVVRLKCGDPFVFGRGGEEMLALAREQVSFEVIPGVSNAVAAAGLAQIPVTHRGTASAFLVISGHCREVAERLLADVAPQSITIVILMGLGRRSQIARYLLADCGWAADTPVACVFAAGKPTQAQWIGSLTDLARTDAIELPAEEAGTIIVGDVVRIAQEVAALASPQSLVAAAGHGKTD